MSHLQVQAVGSQFGYAAVHIEAFFVHSQIHSVGLKFGLAAVQLAFETSHPQEQVLSKKSGFYESVQSFFERLQSQEQDVSTK